MRATITREKLELHGVPLPREGAANLDQMTRELFTYLTHDRASLLNYTYKGRARNWAKNYVKGAKVVQ